MGFCGCACLGQKRQRRAKYRNTSKIASRGGEEFFSNSAHGRLPNDFSSQLLAGRFFAFQPEPGAITDWSAKHESDNPEMRRRLHLELQTILTRLAMGLFSEAVAWRAARRAAGGAAGGAGGDHITRVVAYLAKHYSEPLTIDDVARHAKLNRSYLMHLFRRQCRMSLCEYLMRLRVSHAQRLLTASGMSVAQVALESGYGSLAPFYRAFGRYSGLRPLEFRRRQSRFGTPDERQAGPNPFQAT